MTKLKRVQTTELDRLQGYLAAAQYVFTKGELDVFLEATLFEISDKSVTEEDVLQAAYSRSNAIDYRIERGLEETISGIHEILSIAKGLRRSDWVTEMIENNLREGFWRFVKDCFDYTNARIVELGNDVPYINISRGFTYIFYAPDNSRCLLLVGNTTD
jgi:hypothetical protein